jgi:hypothetical protein
VAIAMLLAISGRYSPQAFAGNSSLSDPLLEHLVGTWVLRGEIAGKSVTHAVKVHWVLDHEYIQIHETANSKTAAGAPQYEAIVYIGWDPDLKKYACLWLDSTGGNGLVGWALGHADANATQLAFQFSDKNGEPSLQNTFTYDPRTNTWRWQIDNIDRGHRQSFGDVKLTRQ